MPTITVNGVNLAYEVFGNGIPIVFTPGGLGTPKESMRWVAGRMSLEYTTLIYDHRNCGASEARYEDAPSEFHLFAEDLYRLLVSLDMMPAYLYGSSAGLVTSLLVAHRHPECVKGLILDSTPFDNLEYYQRWAQGYYIASAEIADSKGMEAVSEFSNDWVNWPRRIKQNPAGWKQFISLGPTKFSALMRRWSGWLTSGRSHFAGLKDEELGQILSPALIIPGMDDFHPQNTAEELHMRLPNSELFSREEFFSPQEIEQLRELNENWIDGRQAAAYTPFYDDFVKRVEAEQF